MCVYIYADLGRCGKGTPPAYRQTALPASVRGCKSEHHCQIPMCSPAGITQCHSNMGQVGFSNNLHFWQTLFFI